MRLEKITLLNLNLSRQRLPVMIMRYAWLIDVGYGVSSLLQIPWALRGLMTDPQCQELFGKDLNDLRNAFDEWHPRTSALKEVRKRLEPIRGRRSRFAQGPLHTDQY